ncbi:MAG: MoxR family ATPase, partial [Verrucomicrobiota bacterium]
QQPEIDAVSNGEELLKLREEVDAVHLSEPVQDYILSLVRATRGESGLESVSKYFRFGASPRSCLALAQSGRALAWLRGEDYVSPGHIQELFCDALRHRVGLTYEAEAEEVISDTVLKEILESTELPESQLAAA